MGILEVSRGHVRIGKQEDISRREEEAQLNVREEGSDRKSMESKHGERKPRGSGARGMLFSTEHFIF